jgi:PAS domain S-box-containing protein
MESTPVLRPFDRRDCCDGEVDLRTTDEPIAMSEQRSPAHEGERDLDLVGAMVVELDREGCIVFINRAGLEQLGYEKSELVGKDWFTLCLPEGERAGARKELERLLSIAGPLDTYENAIVTKRGEQRIIAWRNAMRRDRDGRVVGTLSTGIDVTRTRALEQERERTLRALEDVRFALDVSTIVAITDRNGKITFVNDKFCEISRYAREELLGQDHRIINSGFHPKTFFKEMWATIGHGRVWRGDIRNRAKDGTIYWVATTIIPFVDEHGRPYQYLAIRHEITDRKKAEAELEEAVSQLQLMTEDARSRAEELEVAHAKLLDANKRLIEERAKLIQAEKLSSIGFLAAGVAHEINNPLSGVLGCIKALRHNNMQPAKREEYFETVRDGLERIQHTVRGLLDYSRQRPPSQEALDLAEVIAASLRLIAPAIRKKDLRVVVAVPEGTAHLRVDRAQLMQAIVNVVLNAVYASPDHAEIRLEHAVLGDRIALRIIDHGAGIREEDLNRVCDPFFSTKPEGEGTGLGLAVTLSLVRANGGELDITSKLGSGTTVTLTLPAERNLDHHG